MKKFVLIIFGLLFITGCGPVVFGDSQNGVILTPLVLGDLPSKVIYEDQGQVIATDTIKLTFFGDMMLDRNVKKQIDKNGADWIFQKLYDETSSTLFTSNIVHANLEGPFADKRRSTTKEIAFRFDPALIPTLQKYNFNIFTVANNHSLDMGSAGLKESAQNLAAAGIDFYGDGYGISDEAIKIKEINGIKLAFVGLNDTYFRLENKKIEAIVKKAVEQSDKVIVNIHWGEEYKTISNIRQRAIAHLMIDAGADVIIGHHPHVVQEMEIYKNRPIFYSLGNFVFDQYFSKETQQGLAIELSFLPVTVSNKETANSSSLFAHIYFLQSILSQPQLMTSSISNKFFETWVASSRLNGYNFDNFNTLTISMLQSDI
ncbi:MAG: CapA family protein [Candidatus Magasanikbacteria bacterium]